MARLVMITGPIASGKSTVAQMVAEVLRADGLTVALVDLDTVAEMALPTLSDWAWAHRIHADLVGHWLATSIDVVVDEGTSTLEEVDQVRRQVPPGTELLHIVLTADFEASLARAQGESSRGLSKQPDFLAKDHEQYATELARLGGDLRLHVEGRRPAELAADVVAALRSRGSSGQSGS